MNAAYTLLVEIGTRILPVLGVFMLKIRQFLAAREGLFASLADFRAAHPGPLTWFHVASLGEYEQAKPVIVELKAKEPKTWIVVSFFSPSGYEPASKRPQAGVDYMTYLPLDRKSWAERFVKILQPSRSIFVKYDLWFHHLQALKKHSIPVYLIAASFRPEQPYFAWYGAFFRRMLMQMEWIFTQNEASIQLLNSLGISHASLSGDTRFDRVAATAAQPLDLPAINHWIQGRPTLVIGSAWEEDMNLLLPLIQSKPNWLWIIAPHAIDAVVIDRWATTLGIPSQKYSQWKEVQSHRILFIDNIGMLSSLYQFAQIAYVGGGLGKGLHNILEPLGFGVPVIFGKPKRASKFPEAAQSQAEGCGFAIANAKELQAVVSNLEQAELHSQAVAAAQRWVKANLGAATQIAKHLCKTTL